MNNVAVIGVGHWGSKIVREYLNLKVNLSVCDIDSKRLEFIKKKYKIKNTNTNYKKFLSDSKINAVNICTPSDTHYKICKDSLEAGKHVLLEKPMALSYKNANELYKIAKERNLILMIGHIFHYNQALINIKKMVENDFFGNIFYINYKWTDLIKFKVNDIVFDLGCHMVDILHFLLNKYPQYVTCISNSYKNKLDIAFITLKFNDIISNVELSWLNPEKKREILIIGSKKSAKVDCLNQRIFVYDKSMKELKVKKNNTIKTELSHFLDCINNRRNPETDGKNGSKIIRVLELIKKSLYENKTLKVRL
jgi:UDP-2-acetamido-3-amino-2,3-dideoxy-glucuronate N-acetyltransferase